MRLLSLILLAGCYNEKKYASDVAEAFCTLYDECQYLTPQGFADYSECFSGVEDNYLERECEDFHRKDAKTCVEEVNQMTCQDLYDGDFPSACSKDCLAE